MKRSLVFISFVFVYLHCLAQKHDTLYFLSKENSIATIQKHYEYKVTVVDSLKRDVKFWITEKPGWLHFNAQQYLLTGLPEKAGRYPVHLYASNGKDTIHQFFIVTVHDTHTINILPIGNSITNGTTVYNSYRRDLWMLLDKANYDFDFIGSWSRHHMGGKMPDEDFDLDHEGHSGWTTGDILQGSNWDTGRGNISIWLKMYIPDIVLIELGTNDVFQCVTTDTAINNLKIIINILRQKNEHVKIFIALIPPLGKQWADKKLCGDTVNYAKRVSELNAAIKQLCLFNTSQTSLVQAVDQYTDVDTDTDLYDDIHPNKIGEMIMAQRWYKAIAPFLKKLK